MPRRILLLLAFCLLAWPCRADYLKVTHTPAVIRAEASSVSQELYRPAEGELLPLESDTQTNGYYRVKIPATGETGWIYRTFVRRFPGTAPDPTVPSATTEAAFAERHLRVGEPRILYRRIREGYVLAFDARLKIPLWVQYELKASDLPGPGDRDKSSFLPDTSIPKGFRSEDSDYTGSGFDRGHMAPAADMKRSQRVMDESHLLSNIAPQVGIGFNRDIWAALEDAARGWVVQRGTLTIITGPVFAVANGRVTYETRGGDVVAVPTHFFKIVVDMNDPNNPQALAFLLPNQKITGKKIEDFLVSIDEIERLTGIDFLSALPDDKEDALEAKKAAQIW